MNKNVLQKTSQILNEINTVLNKHALTTSELIVLKYLFDKSIDSSCGLNFIMTIEENKNE